MLDASQAVPLNNTCAIGLQVCSKVPARVVDGNVYASAQACKDSTSGGSCCVPLQPSAGCSLSRRGEERAIPCRALGSYAGGPPEQHDRSGAFPSQRLRPTRLSSHGA